MHDEHDDDEHGDDDNDEGQAGWPACNPWYWLMIIGEHDYHDDHVDHDDVDDHDDNDEGQAGLKIWWERDNKY